MNFLLKQIQKPSKDPNDHQALEEVPYGVAHKSWVGHKRQIIPILLKSIEEIRVHQVFPKGLCLAQVQATSQHWIFTKGYNETTWAILPTNR